MTDAASEATLDLRQTDDEAELVRWLHGAVDSGSPVVLNPAAFTHYSYALRDAAALVTSAGLPLIEVHITNPHARESVPAHERHQRGRIRGHRGIRIRLLPPGRRPDSPFRRRERLNFSDGPARYAPSAAQLPQLKRITSRMASTADIKNGVVLSIDGQLWSVIEFQHVKPGKGGAFVRTKLKNVVTGKVVDRTYNAGAKIEIENVDRRDFTYLYADGDGFVFMDTADYDQITVTDTVVGDAKNFMLENQAVTVALNNGNPLYVELPASVVLEITYTEPGLQGDRSTGGTKPATVETGYEIQVPLFLETGTKVKVDTRTGDYLGRVND